MNYYVIEISTGDPQIQGRAIYGYETEREAVATFHQKLSTAMKSAMFETELVIVLDAEGRVVKREKFFAAEEEGEK